MPATTRFAIFASGDGSNAENIIKYFQTQDCGGEVALLLSNKADSGALTRAMRLGVPCKALTAAEFRDAACLLPLLEKHSVDVIVLAGFLLMIPDFVLHRFEGRVVNIHPSLLPKFGGKGMYGRHVHEAVVAAGESTTGITIHLVSDRCDEGEVIFQTGVALTPADTPETVETKVHALEYEHYPRILHHTFVKQQR